MTMSSATGDAGAQQNGLLAGAAIGATAGR